MVAKVQQIRFVNLIKNDPLYKKWLAKPPTLSGHTAFTPWRLYVQMEENGTWAYKDFLHYTDAYKALAKFLPRAHDLALNCKRQAFKPPIVKAKLEGKKKKSRVWWPRPAYHDWCPFCRRPVIIVKKRSHAAHPKIRWPEPQRMCGICGARAEFMESELGTNLRTPLQWPIS